MLLQQAQMQVANETMTNPVAFSTPEAVPTSCVNDLTSRLDSFMPTF